MKFLANTLIALAIGVVLVGIAVAILVWQLPSLQGTITIGNGGVSLQGFDDVNGDNAGLAMALAGIAVVAAVLAAAIAIVVGLGAGVLALALGLAVAAVSLLLVAAPFLLIAYALWRALRRRPAPARTEAAA